MSNGHFYLNLQISGLFLWACLFFLGQLLLLLLLEEEEEEVRIRTKLSLLSRLSCYESGTSTLGVNCPKHCVKHLYVHCTVIFDITIYKIIRRQFLNSLMLTSNQINIK